MTPESSLIIGVFMLSFSLSRFISGLINLFKYISVRTKGVRSEGLVKELIYDEEERLACRLHVEYNATDGKTYIVESTVGTAFWSKYKDKYIDIVYDRNNPANVFILKELKFRFGLIFVVTAIWTITGLFFLVYGLYLLLFG